jgi:hypothetical protein
VEEFESGSGGCEDRCVAGNCGESKVRVQVSKADLLVLGLVFAATVAVFGTTVALGETSVAAQRAHVAAETRAGSFAASRLPHLRRPAHARSLSRYPQHSATWLGARQDMEKR